MGTPDFAVEPLKALYYSGHEICSVITQPDKPKGRGYGLTPPPVKVFALDNNLEINQPQSLKKIFFEEYLKKISPDVIIVAAYGKILYPYIINYPKHGCLNIHASILPRHRGAAPIQRAIMEGDTKTGVTIMQMDCGIDTGEILYKLECDISENDNFETVHNKLSELGALAIIEVLNMINKETLNPLKQGDYGVSYASKIENEDCLIDFNLSSVQIYNQIRALSPVPLAYTTLNNKKIKIIEAKIISSINDDSSYDIGEVLPAPKGKLYVKCLTGIIEFITIQPEGKRNMKASDLFNGRYINNGDKFK